MHSSTQVYVSSVLTCRVVFEQLVSCWERLNARAMALLPAADGAEGGAAADGGGRGAGQTKKKKQRLQFDSQGQPDWDADQVSPAAEHAQHQVPNTAE